MSYNIVTRHSRIARLGSRAWIETKYRSIVALYKGTAEFIGNHIEEGSDNERRENARNEYQRSIGRVGERNPSAQGTWQWLRDRISQGATGVRKAIGGFGWLLKRGLGDAICSSVQAQASPGSRARRGLKLWCWVGGSPNCRAWTEPRMECHRRPISVREWGLPR